MCQTRTARSRRCWDPRRGERAESNMPCGPFRRLSVSFRCSARCEPRQGTGGQRRSRHRRIILPPCRRRDQTPSRRARLAWVGPERKFVRVEWSLLGFTSRDHVDASSKLLGPCWSVRAAHSPPRGHKSMSERLASVGVDAQSGGQEGYAHPGGAATSSTWSGVMRDTKAAGDHLLRGDPGWSAGLRSPNGPRSDMKRDAYRGVRATRRSTNNPRVARRYAAGARRSGGSAYSQRDGWRVSMWPPRERSRQYER